MKEDKRAWAHTPNKDGKPQYLEEHLRGVAERCQQFASGFDAGSAAFYAGLIHDIGKADTVFQRYLEECHRRKLQGLSAPRACVDHKTAGALLAADSAPLLSFALLGHHGGLPEWGHLRNAVAKAGDKRAAAHSFAETLGLTGTMPGIPDFVKNGDATTWEFFTRMLFSALVDADYLDTEAHFEPVQAASRGECTSIDDLWPLLEASQRDLMAGASSTTVNAVRAEILQQCVEAARQPQGMFRLTVPTGGGKTRSGLAFALRHAQEHHLNRVIVAIPYTSIIDQTAQVYRDIFGPDNVLEHHSAVEFSSGTDEEEDELAVRQRLTCENWNAPIVVTTTVQLFDSLFSCKPSRCRKLHNLARSVLLLDETQTLPVELLTPILSALRELASHYRTSIVLSTATQPALEGNSQYLRGLQDVREIIPEPERYFHMLQRVHYDIRPEKITWEQLAVEMRQHPQVLTVVNARKHALALFDVLADPNALHLSTLMCPTHRREVIEEIKRRLRDGEECRVVSTQVVEAGVDLDFPVVYRAIAPLDRIVQAAGRCNREGRLEYGRVIVFEPEDGGIPRGAYRAGMDESKKILSRPGLDLDAPATFREYFQCLWQDCSTDAKGIQPLRESFRYPDVAKLFRMIDSATVPVLVDYPAGVRGRIIRSARTKGFLSRAEWREAQMLSATVYLHEIRGFEARGLVEQPIADLWVWQGDYGITGISGVARDPTDLVVTEKDFI